MQLISNYKCLYMRDHVWLNKNLSRYRSYILFKNIAKHSIIAKLHTPCPKLSSLP